jgi:hypothetical protein
MYNIGFSLSKPSVIMSQVYNIQQQFYSQTMCNITSLKKLYETFVTMLTSKSINSMGNVFYP